MAILSQCAKKEKQPEHYNKLPNVILILADDIGYGDLGCYGGKISTPNLDKLAGSGIRFTDAHSPAALCAPSRFSMLTGSYPYRSYSAGGAWNTNSPSIFSDPYGHTKEGHMVTIGEVLQNAGYRTAFFGKSHLGGDARDTEGNLIRKAKDISKMDLSKGIHNSINEYGFDYSYFLAAFNMHLLPFLRMAFSHHSIPQGLQITAVQKCGPTDAMKWKTELPRLLNMQKFPALEMWTIIQAKQELC
jgi:arylsulfatase A-like enzyme